MQWAAQCEIVAANEAASVEQSGLVVSGDELENDQEVSFVINVSKTQGHTPSADGIHNQEDFIHHELQDKAVDKEISQYYEITMTKVVDGVEQPVTSVQKDTQTTGKFRVTMEIPEQHRGHKHYSLLHIHCGEVVTLTDLDDDPNTLTFEVDAFSTFALTYTDLELIDEEALREFLVDGDLDSNGKVDVDDVVKLLLHVTMPHQFQIYAEADFTGDGKTNVDDVVRLLLHVTMPDNFPLFANSSP